MIYANGWRKKCNLANVCLSAACSNTWLCLCIDVPPPYYVVCPPFGISIGVCFCMFVLVPALPLTSSFYAGPCVFVSCYSVSFLKCCTLFPILKVDKWDSLCLYLTSNVSLSLLALLYPLSLPLSIPLPSLLSTLFSLSFSLCLSCTCFHPLLCVSIGHNEVIGMCRVGSDAEGPGREHWAAMLANPRKPIEHWHQLVEVMSIWSCVCVCESIHVSWVRSLTTYIMACSSVGFGPDNQHYFIIWLMIIIIIRSSSNDDTWRIAIVVLEA